MFFQRSIATLLEFTFFQISTIEYILVCGNIIAAVSFATKNSISVLLNSSLKNPGSLLSCFLCFSEHFRGKKFATALAVKLSVQCFDKKRSQSAFISGHIQSSSSFSANQDTENLYPSPTLQTCLLHKT